MNIPFIFKERFSILYFNRRTNSLVDFSSKLYCKLVCNCRLKLNQLLGEYNDYYMNVAFFGVLYLELSNNIVISKGIANRACRTQIVVYGNENK